MEIEELTIREIQTAYLKSELTAVELIENYLQRINVLDRSGPCLNSINTINDQALDAARSFDLRVRDSGSVGGLLGGIPVVVKDHIETAGIRTTFGSAAGADYIPKEDAAVVKRLRAEGAIIFAKSAMADFGASWFSTSSFSGVTRNPYALEHDSGGSSSGSAVAVAANLATVGIGGDTGGSVRLPASFCNIVGLRVTPGLISTTGIAPLVAPQDTVGPMAKCVEDIAIVLQTIVGFDARDPMTKICRDESFDRAPFEQESLLGDLGELRLGVLGQLVDGSGEVPASKVSQVFLDAVEELRCGGAQMTTVEVPDLASRLTETSLYLARSRSDLDTFFASRAELDIESVSDLHARGAFHPALDLFEAIATSNPDLSQAALNRTNSARRMLRSDLLEAMNAQKLEALCFPTVQTTPPTHKDVLAGKFPSLQFPTNTVLASQTDLPALSVPIGFTADGFPVGIEILGRPFDERKLLRIGTIVERLFKARRPPRFENMNE